MLELLMKWVFLNLPEGMLFTYYTMYKSREIKLKSFEFWVTSISVGTVVFIIPEVVGAYGFLVSSLISFVIVNMLYWLLFFNKISKKRILMSMLATYMVVGVFEMSFATAVLSANPILMDSLSFKIISFAILKICEFISLYILFNGGDMMKKFFMFGQPEKRTRK